MVTDHERQALRAAILDWSHSPDPLGHLDTRIDRMLSALAPLVTQGDDMARELAAEFELLAQISDQPLTFWTMRSRSGTGPALPGSSVPRTPATERKRR